MKIPFMSGLLVRSVLAASFSSLVACSSVLQATHLSRSFPQRTVEIGAVVPSESEPEQVSFMDEAQRLDVEATYGLPRSMVSGYRWVFMIKNSDQSGPSLGKWVLKPNEQR
jgi:hypothetical protein